MQHPEEQSPKGDGSPKFGRLLIVLILAVLLMVLLTIATEAYYS
ncbi:MAG: hypothetical protein V4488_20970 [Pseudomonadota bacterium]